MAEGTEDEALQVRRVRLQGCAGVAPDAAIELSLESGVTVLVGKNGAGKSLVMAAATNGARTALSAGPAIRFPFEPPAMQFQVEIGTPAHLSFTYRYRLEPLERDSQEPGASAETPEAAPPGPGRYGWYEQCVANDGGNIWRIEKGRLHVGKEKAIPIPQGVGLLSLGPSAVQNPPHQLRDLRRLLVSFSLVPAGVLRRGATRDFILVPVRTRNNRKQPVSPGHERVETLAARLIRVHEADPEIFEEFTKLLSDLGLARRVRVDWFEGLGGDAAGTLSRDKQDTPDALGNVLVDGTNIGLLSDGTLRTFEIVYWLLMRQYGVLWIEEPETAIHPGLLERLLGVIDSYAQDRQVVMSTHSPVVVNWCDPASLRFVERSGHTTRIRPLGPDETQNVIAYLREEGTLDEYVFRPGEAEEP